VTIKTFVAKLFSPLGIP